MEVALGAVIAFAEPDAEAGDALRMGLVQALWQTQSGAQQMQARARHDSSIHVTSTGCKTVRTCGVVPRLFATGVSICVAYSEGELQAECLITHTGARDGAGGGHGAGRRGRQLRALCDRRGPCRARPCPPPLPSPPPAGTQNTLDMLLRARSHCADGRKATGKQPAAVRAPAHLLIAPLLSGRPLAGAREAVAARRLQRAWRGTDQAAAAAADEALRGRNVEAAAAGRALEYVFRSLYLPEQGMFCQLPADLQLGTRLPVRGRLALYGTCCHLHCLYVPIRLPPCSRAMLLSCFDMAGIQATPAGASCAANLKSHAIFCNDSLHVLSIFRLRLWTPALLQLSSF